MKIIVFGSNGKVGTQLLPLLSKDHQVFGFIRHENQRHKIEQLGGIAILGNLEDANEVSNAVRGMDVVVFTAGSGGHTGPDKTIMIDLLGAFKAIDAAVQNKTKLFVMVSATGARDPENTKESMRHYFVAKAEADKYLINSGLNYLIFRPGRLNDHAPVGKLKISNNEPLQGTTSRADLATAMAHSLKIKDLKNQVIDIIDGDSPIPAIFDHLT